MTAEPLSPAGMFDHVHTHKHTEHTFRHIVQYSAEPNRAPHSQDGCCGISCNQAVRPPLFTLSLAYASSGRTWKLIWGTSCKAYASWWKVRCKVTAARKRKEVCFLQKVIRHCNIIIQRAGVSCKSDFFQNMFAKTLLADLLLYSSYFWGVSVCVCVTFLLI